MIRTSIVALALASIVGCSSSTTFQPLAGNDKEEAKMAAYAASNKYPDDMKPSGDLRVGAIVNNDGKIKIVNFTDQPVNDCRVWVNGIFVTHVDTIPAHGSVSVKDTELFDSSGHSLAGAKVLPNRIEVEGKDHLFSVYSASLQ